MRVGGTMTEGGVSMYRTTWSPLPGVSGPHPSFSRTGEGRPLFQSIPARLLASLSMPCRFSIQGARSRTFISSVGQVISSTALPQRPATQFMEGKGRGRMGAFRRDGGTVRACEGKWTIGRETGGGKGKARWVDPLHTDGEQPWVSEGLTKCGRLMGEGDGDGNTSTHAVPGRESQPPAAGCSHQAPATNGQCPSGRRRCPGCAITRFPQLSVAAAQATWSP